MADHKQQLSRADVATVAQQDMTHLMPLINLSVDVASEHCLLPSEKTASDLNPEYHMSQVDMYLHTCLNQQVICGS